MNILDRIWQKIVINCAIDLMERHRRRQPEMVVISGDYVSIKAMLQGRFEDQELSVLEREIFPKLKTRKCCIDIGANIGNHSLSFSKSFEQVIAFEPNPKVFDVLSLNARWNPKITPVQIGASNRQHFVEAVVPQGNLGAAQIVGSSTSIEGETVRFECARVDEYISPDQFSDIGFIKIDVEGHEYEALLGCEAILKHAHPVLGFELLRQDYNKNAARIAQFLGDVGYSTFFEITSTGLKEIKNFKRKNYKMIIAIA